MTIFGAQLTAEQEAIWQKCRHPSGRFVRFEKPDIEQPIAGRFEQIAERFPRRVAVKCAGQSITYEGLNRAANRVARAILAKRGDRNEPVILLLEQGIDIIVAILGALKAGKIYVPLDPSFPPERIATIAEDCRAALVLTHHRHLQSSAVAARQCNDCLLIDGIDGSLGDQNVGLKQSADALSCILYTSGSTGRPKGVVQNHLGIMHRVMVYTNMLGVCASDRLTLLHSASFGSSIHHLFSSLLNGAALYPFESPLGAGLPLARRLIEDRISIYHSAPSLFRHLTGALLGVGPSFLSLRAVVLTGAPIYAEDVYAYKKYFSEPCVLVHLMGATETGWIRRYAIDHGTAVADGIVPVGFAVEDKNVLLIDDLGRPSPPGKPGEIAVRSRYLAVGYWNNAELTQEKFFRPADGNEERIYRTADLGRFDAADCLFHLGRRDSLVKIRGFRVEIEEVESALRALAEVRDAAVVALHRDDGETSLAAYVVPDSRSTLTPTRLRRLLRQRLPDYMIPQTFTLLDRLPLTPNGKIDRRALPPPHDSAPSTEGEDKAPVTDVEKTLAKIWAEAFQLNAVSIHDDFLDLGGHSLLAARIIARIYETFRVEVSLRDLLDASTVAGLARRLADRNPSDHKGVEIDEI